MALQQQRQNIEQLREKVAEKTAQVEKPEELLKQSLDGLATIGGFDLLEVAIDGVQNLNPERKARKKIFLTEESKKGEREEVKKTLQLWAAVVSSADNIMEMLESCEQSAQVAESTLTKNLGKAIEATKELEKSYRTVALFFKNTGSNKIKNITFLNAAPDQLKDLDDTRFIDAIQAELVQNFDRLDLRDNYSLLVVPGYLGSNKVVEKWAKIAHENKVMLITDFEHLDTPDDVMEMFESANLTGGDIYRSNVLMTCNYLVGRDKYKEVGEDEELYIPPSGALAGTIYQTLMSQVAAGKKHGSLSEVDGVRFDLKKSEIANLEKLGLIPMVNEYGKVMAFSAKTLFNGDNLGLQTYSVVRVFDYVTKVLMDFLNRRAFENFNTKTRREILSQITRFLDSITGPGKLIEKFSIKRFEQDRIQKDRIHLDIHMTPYFPAKNFMIKMDGQKGDDGNEWDTEYEQN
ncbi:MAG: type VI secretion system contractile sheath protein TssC [Bacteroidales bacterium]|nr:type VI secretion system contractile sheath protein TssC [Bacteroidales bacterium]